MVMPVPLGRDGIGAAPDIDRVSLCQGGLKRFPASYVLVDTVTCIDSPQRRIWERPLSGIEAIALIDKRPGIPPLLRSFAEYGLSPVTVGSPFIQHCDTREVRNVPDFRQHAFRKIVKDDLFERIARIS